MGASYGSCFYAPGDTPGTLSAVWRSVDMPEGLVGTGIAVGGPTDGTMAGTYQITYYAPDGSIDAKFDLNIKQAGHSFSFRWSVEGKIQCEGTGIEAAGGIALAYMVP